MAWIPFEARDAELQQKITTAAAAAQPPRSAADFYNQHDLGHLEPAQLSSWLDEAVVQGSAAPPQDTEPESLPEITETEAFDARSLRWLRLNGRTSADKNYAKQRYRQMLFELWRKHIADTGQTYYPMLREDLMDRFRVLSDQDHT